MVSMVRGADNHTVTLRYCRLVGNTAGEGAAAYIYRGAISIARSLVTNHTTGASAVCTAHGSAFLIGVMDVIDGREACERLESVVGRHSPECRRCQPHENRSGPARARLRRP